MVRGTGRFTSPHSVVVEGPDGVETIEFDAALVATGSRPRIPDWCEPDGERILTTRDCYPPQIFPESVTVVGSGVTGVEFVHMFSSFGAKVTLVVSRQQVLPGKDPEVAAVLEEEFMRRGVKLLMGARAESMERTDDGVVVHCDDGRVGSLDARRAGHRVDPEHRGRRPRRGRCRGRSVGLRRHQPALRDQRGPHLRRRRHQRQAAAVVGRVDAGPQGRRARDGRSHPQSPAPRLRQGRLGDLHRARDRRRRPRRGRGVQLRSQDPRRPRCRSRRPPRR